MSALQVKSAYYAALTCLLASCLVIATCGGGSRGSIAAVNTGGPNATQDLAAAPVVGIAAFPAPLDVLRHASYLDADRACSGALFDPAAPSRNVTISDGSASFTPSWLKPDNLGNDDLAYAMYTFSLEGYGDAPELSLGWSGTAPDSGDTFVGLGEIAADAWHWHNPSADNTVVLPSMSPYVAGDGGMVVAVVLTTSGTFTLDWVRIGENVAPIASFIADRTAGNLPLTVEFDSSASMDLDGSLAIIEYDLDGNGSYEDNTSGLGILNHEFTSTGTFDAKMKLIDNDGATSYGYQAIVVNDASNDPPVADLSANPTSGPPGLVVNFDATGSYDPDGSITLVEWDFDGNGTYETDTGTMLTTQHTFNSLGKFNATVRVFDDLNVSDTDFVAITISESQPNTPPTAELTVDPEKGPQGTMVVLDASGSVDTDGTITLYEWDFNGDGSYDASGASSSNIFTYLAGGLFNAKVRVTDDDGATDTAQAPVIIYNETEHNDSYDTGNQFPGTNFSGWYGNCGIDGYDGDYHDWYKLNISAAGWVTFNMYHTHLDSDLDMHLFDTDGTTQLKSATSVTDNESFAYEFTAAGTYYWEIYVHLEHPEVADYMLETWPGIAPTAALTATPDEGDGPLPVVLDASASTDDGSIVLYEWDFDGDGTYDTSGASPTANHTYTTSGIYDPVVRVTDNDGLKDTATDRVTVSGGPPEASFTATPSSGARVLEVALDASASTGVIVKYEWDFDGNGIYDLTKTSGADIDLATAFYFSTGTFNVKLQVTDNLDRTDTATRTVTVSGDADNESEPNNDGDVANTAGDAAVADVFPALPFANWYGHVGPIPVDSGPFNDPDDWYRFTVASASEVVIYMELFDAICDIDMALYAQGDYTTSLASSVGTDDDELITINLDPGTYFLRVYSWNSTTNDGKEGGYRVEISSGPPSP